MRFIGSILICCLFIGCGFEGRFRYQSLDGNSTSKPRTDLGLGESCRAGQCGKGLVCKKNDKDPKATSCHDGVALALCPTHTCQKAKGISGEGGYCSSNQDCAKGLSCVNQKGVYQCFEKVALGPLKYVGLGEKCGNIAVCTKGLVCKKKKIDPRNTTCFENGGFASCPVIATCQKPSKDQENLPGLGEKCKTAIGCQKGLICVGHGPKLYPPKEGVCMKSGKKPTKPTRPGLNQPCTTKYSCQDGLVCRLPTGCYQSEEMLAYCAKKTTTCQPPIKVFKLGESCEGDGVCDKGLVCKKSKIDPRNTTCFKNGGFASCPVIATCQK